jgi:hypothetical protein
MSGTLKVGGKTLATHDTNTNVAKIQLGSTSDVVLTDSAGNNVLSESGGTVTLTADTAVIGGSSSGDLVRITQTGSGNALVVEDSTNPDSTPFVVNSSGNVGIGNSSPYYPLQVSRNVSAGTLSSGGNLDVDYSGQGIQLGTQSTATSNGVINVGSASGSCIFSGWNGSTNVERMRIDSSGRVGIGTNSPTGELHLKGADQAFRIEDTSSGNMQFGQWDGSNNRIQSSSRPFQLITTDSQPITLYTNDTERMRIDSSGNVGIGTSSPSSRLEVAGDASPTVTMKSTSGPYSEINSNTVGSLTLLADRGDTGASTNCSIYVDGNLEFRVTPGNVTISNLGSGDVYATNGTLYISSDIRLKNDLGVINESGIEIIKQLTPRYYSWKDDESSRQQLGFFAQEVFPILPEAVPRDLKYEQNGFDENNEPILEQVLDENGDPDYQWGFATQPIVAMLVKAIQEQQALIESQQSQIDALAARIEALEATP